MRPTYSVSILFKLLTVPFGKCVNRLLLKVLENRQYLFLQVWRRGEGTRLLLVWPGPRCIKQLKIKWNFLQLFLLSKRLFYRNCVSRTL